MQESQVFELLERHKNPRGIENWEKVRNAGGLKSYGIGLTVLRKLAKKIGKNRQLAHQLFASTCYDAKVLGLLIDDPKEITIEQAEQQVEQLNFGMLGHVFSSCDATLAKSKVAFELAQKWLKSDDAIRRRCSFGLIYELSKKKSANYTDAFFLSIVQHIELTFEQESKTNRLAMGGALMGIGKRNALLNQVALALANKIGPIDFNEDGQKCDPFDVSKHLISEALIKKLGIKTLTDS